MEELNSFKVFSGSASKYLTEQICEHLGVPVGACERTNFSDGEFAVGYDESLRDKNIVTSFHMFFR